MKLGPSPGIGPEWPHDNALSLRYWNLPFPPDSQLTIIPFLRIYLRDSHHSTLYHRGLVEIVFVAEERLASQKV